MSKPLAGRVVKGVSSRFFVDTEKGVVVAVARKKLRFGGNILVGDKVEMIQEHGDYVIEKIFDRKNKLIRPYVANVDICLIVVAVVPEPDFILVDKIIVNCFIEGIEPILVLNKSDLGKVDAIEDYKKIVDVEICSAVSDEGIDTLLKKLDNKTVCFAGQSAVGKSSLINAILKSDRLKTNGLTKKIQRGMHTTRQTELIKVDECFLIDTCGFSMLDAVDIEPESLKLYYDEFEEFAPKCQFSSCNHLNEPNCAVKEAVGKGISIDRYERYKTIFQELVDRKNKKFQ